MAATQKSWPRPSGSLAKRVSVGSHPGFPDLWGFGRRVMPFTPAQIERIVAYQIGAAQALATYSGHRMTYMKTHGALGNLTERDPAVAEAIVNAVKAVDANLPIMAIALSHLERIGRERGLTVFSEIFADRAYTEDGHLVSRKEPGAVLHDADFAAARAVRMVQNGAIETISGKCCPHASIRSASMATTRNRSRLPARCARASKLPALPCAP